MRRLVVISNPAAAKAKPGLSIRFKREIPEKIRFLKGLTGPASMLLQKKAKLKAQFPAKAVRANTEKCGL